MLVGAGPARSVFMQLLSAPACQAQPFTSLLSASRNTHTVLHPWPWRRGDENLRDNYQWCQKTLLEEAGARPVKVRLFLRPRLACGGAALRPTVMPCCGLQ